MVDYSTRNTSVHIPSGRATAACYTTTPSECGLGCHIVKIAIKQSNLETNDFVSIEKKLAYSCSVLHLLALHLVSFVKRLSR